MMSTLSRRKFNAFLAAALTQTLITRPTPRHAARGATTSLNALDDLHLANDGTGATANLQKLTDAMVSLYQNYGGGEIYFPPGTYAVNNQIRPLPNITFRGIDPATTILKNTYASTNGTNIYWNAALLFAGHDQPLENGSFYRIFAATPQRGAKEIQVFDADYQAVNKGDEIKLLSATNSTASGRDEHWPDSMLKAIVVDKQPIGSSRVLYLDRPIPWTLPSTGSSVWGTGPTYTGVPVWIRVKDWYNQTSSPLYPLYWMQTGNYGYNAYLNMGSALGQGNLWVRGWSSRRNTFQNLTLWSLYGQVMYRGLPCDALFDNCIFKGRKAFYGNGCQYTTFNNCQAYFWDQCGEMSYNCYKCTFNNLVAQHDATLQPADSPDAITDSMGMLTLHERSEGFLFNGMTLKASTRPFTSTNRMIEVNGDNNEFRHVQMEVPQVPGTILRIAQQNALAQPPSNVRFRDLQIDMKSNSFTNLLNIQWGSSNVFLGGVQFLNTNNPTGGNILMQETNCSNVTYADIGTLPGALQANQYYPNSQVIRCKFNGGITGTYKNTLKVTAGTPNFALYK